MICSEHKYTKHYYNATLDLHSLAAFVLALLIHPEFTLFEISWSFSIWLEALAIIPQLDMVRRNKEVFCHTTMFPCWLIHLIFFTQFHTTLTLN